MTWSEAAARVVVARAHDERGELALARRGDVLELVVDGVFAMDTAHTATERALATLALERLSGDGLRVLVGGLGLGVTARTALDEPRVARVDVVELHGALVAWARDGLLPALSWVVADDDERLCLVVGDVLDVVPALPGATYDAMLLDVDNGPGFLVHEGNRGVYATPFLASAARALRPGGVLAVWSADPAPALADALAHACGPCDTVTLDVARDGREFTYTLYLARHPG